MNVGNISVLFLINLVFISNKNLIKKDFMLLKILK
jgi:hypothetical protein